MRDLGRYGVEAAGVSEIARIPVVDYLAVLVLAGLIGGGLWIARRLQRPQEAADDRLNQMASDQAQRCN